MTNTRSYADSFSKVNKPNSATLSVSLVSSRDLLWPAIVLLLSFASLPSFANEKYEQLVDQLVKCQKIANKPNQAKCFEELTVKVSSPRINSKQRIKKPIASSDKNKIESDLLKKRAGSEYLKSSDKPEGIQPLQFTLTKARKDKLGFWRFYFENGQVWRQVEKRRIPKIKKFPTQSSLTSGVFGSYRLKVGSSSRTIKVKRLK